MLVEFEISPLSLLLRKWITMWCGIILGRLDGGWTNLITLLFLIRDIIHFTSWVDISSNAHLSLCMHTHSIKLRSGLVFAAISNLWDISFRAGYNSRYIPYLPFTCFLPAETWSWSKVPLQCFEGILCLWQRSWICSGLRLSVCSLLHLIYARHWIILNG